MVLDCTGEPSTPSPAPLQEYGGEIRHTEEKPHKDRAGRDMKMLAWKDTVMWPHAKGRAMSDSCLQQWEDTFLLLETSLLVIICYGSPRTLTRPRFTPALLFRVVLGWPWKSGDPLDVGSWGKLMTRIAPSTHS